MLQTQEEDLMSIQIQLEESMTRRGAENYMRSVQKSIETGREESTAYGQTILSHRVATLAEAIQAWKDEVAAGKAGTRALAYQRCKDIDSKILAFLTLRAVMTGISAVRSLQFVAVTIGTSIEDEVRFEEIRERERKAYERILIGAKKRTSGHYRHMYAVRQADKVDEDWERWSRTDRLHVGVKLLDICMTTVGIVRIMNYGATDGKAQHTLKYIEALPETLEWIDKKNEVMKYLRPVYEPMVVIPKDWTNPFNGGYISTNIKPIKLVKTKNKAYLDELKDVDMPIVYEGVNALQRTAWQINSQVLEVMSHLWDIGSELAGLPPKDSLELPRKPDDIATNEEAQRGYRIEAARVHVKNLSLQGHRVSFNMTLGIAKRYEPFRKIYFPYQLDFRGRIYAVPHLNPQGSDNQKALLRFANGKPLGSEGWKWLAIHGANVAGYDKASFEDRVNWVLDNEDEIVAIANDPYENRGWATAVGGVDIDKPWQFLAFCFEWAGYVEHGESFVSKLPVAMDGSCSGIQHFSAMLRDEVGGAAVNLVPGNLPADVYQLVANKVIEQVKHDVEEGTEDQLKHSDEGVPYVKEGTKTIAKQWLEFGITRKVTKRSVMTLAYGSKEYGFKEQLMEDIIRPAKQSGKEFPFTADGFQAAAYMAKAIWNAVNQVLVKAGEAMKWLQSAASLAASEGLPVRWTTPVGFPVMQEYMNVEERRVKTALNGRLVYLTMHKTTDTLDRRRQSQGIAPNFVHSCDAAHMMLTVVRAKQAGIDNFACIHDSFGTTAGDSQALYHIIRDAFVEMYSEIEVLESFRDEIVQQIGEKKREELADLPSRGTLDLSGVLESRYCFA